MRVGSGAPRRVRFWLALRGPPPGRRLLLVMVHLTGFVTEMNARRPTGVYDRIIQTPAGALAGIFAKLEWGERDPEVTEAVIADLQRWLRARS
jgi:hypothetical protein